MGFKEIEVAFPSASQTDFDFVRSIIESGAIPDGVAIQVLTQCRPELIERTFEAVKGAKKVIVHFYNSTSTLQREVVFKTDRKGVTEIAVNAARQVKALAEAADGATSSSSIRPRASPAPSSSSRSTSARRSRRSSSRRLEAAHPQPAGDRRDGDAEHLRRPVRVVRPAHIRPFERDPFGSPAQRSRHGGGGGGARADGRRRAGRGHAVRQRRAHRQRRHRHDGAEPVHPRGRSRRSISATSTRIKEIAEHCNQLPVHQRHPYVGELVYTAFSGSHQDAIKKGFEAQAKRNDPLFLVPYLPIDPKDVGRDYEAVIRINSQSGKGGMAYILQRRLRTRPSALAAGRVLQDRAGADGRGRQGTDLAGAMGAVSPNLSARRCADDACQAADRSDQPRQPRTRRDAAQGGRHDVRDRRARATARSTLSSTR